MQPVDQILQWITQIPNFSEIGSFFVFLVSIIPFAPVPAEGIIAPLLLLTPEQGVEHLKSQLIILVVIGEMISHSIVFYIVRNHMTSLIKRLGVSDQNINQNHAKVGKSFLIIIPSIIILPFLTDLTVAWLAHKKATRFEEVLILFVGGEIIRGLLFIYGIFSLFSL